MTVGSTGALPGAFQTLMWWKDPYIAGRIRSQKPASTMTKVWPGPLVFAWVRFTSVTRVTTARGRRDKIAARLNFHADGTASLLAEADLGVPQEMPKGHEISAGGSWAIGMWNATAKVHGLYVRVDLQTGGEKTDQMLHVAGKFRHRRP